MTSESQAPKLPRMSIEAFADAAIRRIPPAWPLASSVAVNPFIGHTCESLAETGAKLARIGGVPVTMPRDWYRARIADGTITDLDLEAALEASTHHAKPDDLHSLKAEIAKPAGSLSRLPTIADLAAQVTDVDWPSMLSERLGAWAGAYFDQGQALWAAARGKRAWAAWRIWARYDLTPEIQGLKGFTLLASDLPGDPIDAIAEAAQVLGLPEKALPTYFHQLLHAWGGWAQYARYALWRAELDGGSDFTLLDMLAIRLAWEVALYQANAAGIAARWAAVRDEHAAPLTPGIGMIVDEILQEAAERAEQRRMARTLANTSAAGAAERPLLQAAFCIDVRSEVFRRALEAANPSIRTIGFAGFFGMFTKHRRFASDLDELRLPVLLNPSVFSCSGASALGDEDSSTLDDLARKDLRARYAARAKRAWGRFKLAAVSSFAFVEASGPAYVPKLLRDGLGLSRARKQTPHDPPPRFSPAFTLDRQISTAETVLRAMSLTDGFARIVLLTGHGANVVNNPHASALHCGACGGYPGDVNARLLAQLLNDQDVRRNIAERGIAIPADTLFVGALHDTTTDNVTLYEYDNPSPDHTADLDKVKDWLARAGKVARGERALRLPQATSGEHVLRRARNWAELRPEWGLAGCTAFIAAPRSRTAGRELEGRAFLHDYDWTLDAPRGFPVLELILTAPVVVASWISMQYYGSTVAPDAFGSGNKLLHNVVGGIGVLEGNNGTLRTGLPWQSVHDGERYVHGPLRLSVCVEAPPEAITNILDRHPRVRELFDNKWLHLFAMDAHGCLAQRYTGNLTWEGAFAPTAKVFEREAA